MRFLNILATLFVKLFKLPVYVGIMGFSGQKFDLRLAGEHLNDAFVEIQRRFPDNEIVIVSGYTNLGIPAMAYALAKKLGWKTAGIACSKAMEYDCYPCDKVQIVGNNWGDESPTFLKECLIFIRVGGGKQTIKETASAKAMGKLVIEHDLEALPA